MGRFEDTGSPDGPQGDYYIVTDAIDCALWAFIVEDDIAEPSIYAETMGKVAAHIERLHAFFPVCGRCKLPLLPDQPAMLVMGVTAHQDCTDEVWQRTMLEARANAV